MAGPSNAGAQFDPQFYLDPTQQDLLLAALSSNGANRKNDPHASASKRPGNNPQQPRFSVDPMNPALFASPQQGSAADFGLSMDHSPFGDFLDGDTLTGDPSFDFDSLEADDLQPDDLMIGGLPGEEPQANQTEGQDDIAAQGESGEKRKSPGDDTPDADNGNKRREGSGDDKTAKKPGRKPLTSEPTSKRKAQNRAAQRAFRERKEKHLKDLEAKVQELEKASDAANHENGLLRAQVERLQTELREYRKRLSMGASLGRLPSLGAYGSVFGASNSNLSGNNFNFEFPKFGGLPGSQFLNSTSTSKPANDVNGTSSNKPSPQSSLSGVLARHNSTGRSLSPRSQANGSGSSANSPDKNGAGAQRSNSLTQTTNSGNTALVFGHAMLAGLGSPSSGFSASPSAEARNGRSSIDSSSGLQRTFQFNANSNSSSGDSPSASSQSQYGPNSSCGTSPEPSHNSPGKAAEQNKDSIKDGYVCHSGSEAQQTSPPGAAAGKAKTPASDINGIDWFANQNGGQFDPVLFGDYRDSQTAIVGDGEFSGGFFNDAFPIQDWASPFHFGDTPAVQKSNPMEEIEKVQGGADEEVVPGEDTSQMLSCHKIWDKLQRNEAFKEGNIDIDNLCSELRAKARCSESGVVVDHKDVEAALQRLPSQTPGK